MHPQTIPVLNTLRLGVLLQACSILWLAVEALAAISVGLHSRSFLLLALGVESDIELTSAALLLWSLARRDRARESRCLERADPLAARFVGVAFSFLAVFVLAAALLGLASRSQPAASPLSILVAGAALLVTRGLSMAKYRVAERSDNDALLGDAMILRDHASMAAVVLTGLLLTAVAGWWWAEDVAALLFLLGLIEEARNTLAVPGDERGGVPSAA